MICGVGKDGNEGTEELIVCYDTLIQVPSGLDEQILFRCYCGLRKVLVPNVKRNVEGEL